MDLKAGSIYRRRDLHTAFGGQRQGGISTPASKILLFTGFSGGQHGYEDGWDEGVFCYFGEGQNGDMLWVRGNRAIRDHQLDNRDLCLFQMLDRPRSHVRFLGLFVAGSWEYRRAPDRAGTMRRAIVFHLTPADQFGDIDTTADQRAPEAAISLAELQKLANQAGTDVPARDVKQALVTVTQRAALVRTYARARSAGICEACDEAAPFQTATGQPFLEVHHIDRLSDGGPDRPDMVAAICPNCHREAHFGRDRIRLNSELKLKVSGKERRIAAAG